LRLRTWHCARTLSALALLVLATFPVPAYAAPAPPASFIDTTPTGSTGQTIAVPSGGDLQAALNNARLGDVITLPPGAVFRGPFNLPNKSGNGWITVRSATADVNLPPPGTRITPSYAAFLPKIVTPNSGAALTTAPGAHHYRFVGVEFAPMPGVFTSGLILLGTGDETDVNTTPSNIIFDRCYIHGDPSAGGKRGIAMNSRSTAVIDSHLSDWKGFGMDTQAIASWNGAGPFKIVNNYIEGAGENVMFGGADPMVPNLVPSDIEFRRNWVRKPPAWNINDTSVFAGARWSVKNLFELKNARRVLVDGNLFENNWVDGQAGFAILFTVRNQDGRAPWSVVSDIAFTNNIVRHTASGLSILGTDDLAPSQRTSRILVRNNLFDDVGDGRWGGIGRLFMILDGAVDVVFDHNTGMATGNIVTTAGAATSGFVYRNSIANHNAFGVIGDSMGPGTATLNAYFPSAEFTKNVVIGANASSYPANNFFPASGASVGFTNPGAGDYRLTSTSPYKNAATDGKDVGVDMNAINAAMDGSGSSPAPAPAPNPAPAAPSTLILSGGSCPCTLFPAETVPARPSALADTASVELGMKFTADVDGTITAIRFYKGSTNTGTHVGKLWSGSGALLASVTFSAESETGWQQANLTAPVAITANTEYVVSYHASVGGFAFDEGYFAGGVERAPLRAPVNASVYVYGESAFPTQTYNNSNYYVDVVFTPTTGGIAGGPAGGGTGGADTGAPTVSIAVPGNGSTVSGTVPVTVTSTDNLGVARLELRIDGTLVGTFTTGTASYSWNTAAVTAGAHTLEARAFDAAGNSSQSVAAVTVRQPVTGSVTLTEPAAGSTIGSSVVLAASATDTLGLSMLRFYVNGVRIGGSSCSGGLTCTGSVTWATDNYLPAGPHIAFVVATSTSGVDTVSTAVSLMK
jgi:hypothetical protein